MLTRSCVVLSVLGLICGSCAASAHAQHTANSNATYEQLRTLVPAGQAIAVKNLVLKRDGGVFTFTSGSLEFYPAVNGKVTGAVFEGQGHFHLTPPTAQERHNLAVLTNKEAFDEDFAQAVLRFTDGTAAELRKGSTGAGQTGPNFAEAARDLHTFHEKKLFENIDLRVLEDVLSPAPGGYFFAAIQGTKDHDLFFTVDPHGAPDVAPEEVSLMNWTRGGEIFLSAYHAGTKAVATPVAKPGADETNEAVRITHDDLNTTIQRNGFLNGTATVQMVALADGVAVTPFALYPTLRVSSVTTGTGAALDFVQEKEKEDADFGVILAKPLKKGESATLRISYAGKKVVMDEGDSNYYPIARQSWYPNAAEGLGDYTTYHMVFHVHKGLDLVATGTKLSESTKGGTTTTEWKTKVPLAVVGFNLGKFQMKEADIHDKEGDKLTVDAYANTSPPDMFSSISRAEDMLSDGIASRDNQTVPTGTVAPTRMLPMQLSQGAIAADVYTHYFGPLPFGHIAVTQQFACNYGQSWPMLVYLPICGFLDATQKEAFGLSPSDMYWKTVTPHEVAHQWWGQTVGFRSYRDQWMSEGFANESAALFLMSTGQHAEYMEFWKQQLRLLTEKNSMGFRPVDVGPVTMGFRLSTKRTGWYVYQNLVYPKGAYILHMIRMMMWSSSQGDTRFKAMMHDFVNTYRLKPATTEDFKAEVEKYMTPEMDLDKNHTMDWFFNEYVYGTALPVYHFEGQATPDAKGWKLHFKLTQSGVSQSFKDIVPLYVQLANGTDFRLGFIHVTGLQTVEQTVQLPKLRAAIKEVEINHNYDVLCAYN